MAWSKLKDRLNDLPLIIAGPILRQVTPKAVTVWVALKDAADVTLSVYDQAVDPGRTLKMSAHRVTTSVGKHLHIVAVTARSATEMAAGSTLYYDLTLAPLDGSAQKSLNQAITRPGKSVDPSRLSYERTLPSFALPPKELTGLRLIHGSCRKPHGGSDGDDALALLDGLIKESMGKSDRPHQLILSGDQIYADEVEESLLEALTDAGDTLLGWTDAAGKAVAERLPGVGNDGPYEAAKLLPGTRKDLLKDAGLTSDDLRSHLMSLGEYLAMYLFVWSEELWLDVELSSFPEIYAKYSGPAPRMAILADMAQRKAPLARFRKTLPGIRRALANIPTYMICDDHDVTDDWNMTLDFCKVYENSLGIRVVQNALVAYSLCQAWGNLPEQFADTSPQPAGLVLLNTLTEISKGPGPQTYDSNSYLLKQIVGVHFRSEMKDKASVHVFHDVARNDPIRIEDVPVSTTSLRFHYSIEGPAHQIIVSDTRSWRTFLDGLPPSFLFQQLDSQLSKDVPPLKGRQLMLVLSTNAPQVASVRKLGSMLHGQFIEKFDAYDSWDFPSRATDELIAALSSKFLQDNAFDGSVVFLSGDVHFSFASRLAYWAEVGRLGDISNCHGKLVIAQLVASSLKNQDTNTLGMESGGYTYCPLGVEIIANYLVPGIAELFIKSPHVPEVYVGWNLPLGNAHSEEGLINVNGLPMGNLYLASTQAPTTTLNLDTAKTVAFKNRRPDYRYRLEFLSTSKHGQIAPPPVKLPVADPKSPFGALANAAAAIAAQQALQRSGASLPHCVGHNNIGDVRFSEQKDPVSSSGTSRQVLHRLYSRSNGKDRWWVQYEVSLNTKDNKPDAYPWLPPVQH